ncbi:hypothetical protein MHU86_21090 [Fragilaria crotonensis]|nr:hypothetical protein MHU86_21090 [Fragilaria crotonensis]
MPFSNSNQHDQYKEDDQDITLPTDREGRNTVIEESFVAGPASLRFSGPASLHFVEAASTSLRRQGLEYLPGQFSSRDNGPPHIPRTPEEERRFLLSVLQEALHLCRDDDTFQSGPPQHPRGTISQSEATGEAKQRKQQ